jgi:serine/threonine protein kinase
MPGDHLEGHPPVSPGAPLPSPTDLALSSSRGPKPGEDPRIGTTLGGRYYVRRLCGEGAMGRVYEGQHIDIGRRVAIKVLHAGFHHSADLVERFRREARAASKIGHANIVDVTDSGTTPDGAFYFVMEYLDGIDLEDLIGHNGPLPIERALLITAQIARALEAAHAAEIIHRDLKPANVMLVNRKEEEDFVKVLDFGISKDLDLALEGGPALTRPDVAIGTPAYMAPEQAAGKAADPLTDLYAVGGLLYEMLSGQAPCSGEDAIAVLHKKAHEDPVPIGKLRPDLLPELQRLVTRALARSPKDRQPSMTALKEEVLACLSMVSGAPIQSGPTSLAPTEPVSERQPEGRRPARKAAAVVAVAALAGVGLLLRAVIGQMSAGSSDDKSAGRAPASLAERRTEAPARPDSRLTTHTQSRGASAPGWPEPGAAGARHREPVAAPAHTPTAGHRETLREAMRARSADRRGLGGFVTPTGDPPPARGRLMGSPGDAILLRGQAAFDRGEYPEAVRRGREAVAAGAALGGRLLVGDAYYRLERYGDALREYRAALAIDPNNASARRQVELAERAVATH